MYEWLSLFFTFISSGLKNVKRPSPSLCSYTCCVQGSLFKNCTRIVALYYGAWTMESVREIFKQFLFFQIKYREAGRKECSRSLYSHLPDTNEIQLSRELTEIQSEVVQSWFGLLICMFPMYVWMCLVSHEMLKEIKCYKLVHNLKPVQ